MRRSDSVTCANSLTPLGTRKHLNPNTPLSHSGRISPAFPGTTPPQNPVSTHSFPAAAASFSPERRRGCRRGNTIQRHFDERRNSSGSGCTCRSRKTFPFRAARLVDVDVRVNESGHDNGITCFLNGNTDRNIVESGDRRNHAAANVNGRRNFSGGRHNAPSANNQIRIVARSVAECDEFGMRD